MDVLVDYWNIHLKSQDILAQIGPADLQQHNSAVLSRSQVSFSLRNIHVFSVSWTTNTPFTVRSDEHRERLWCEVCLSWTHYELLQLRKRTLYLCDEWLYCISCWARSQSINHTKHGTFWAADCSEHSHRKSLKTDQTSWSSENRENWPWTCRETNRHTLVNLTGPIVPADGRQKTKHTYQPLHSSK